MTDAAGPIRNAVATSLGDGAVLVTTRRGRQGPWTLVADVPESAREPLGPPPGLLALVGIATCTIVTVSGVDSRGGGALEELDVAFDVEVAAGGRPWIRQTTTLHGALSESDELRLTRTVRFCPVGRDFSQRGVDLVDVVDGAAAASDPGSSSAAASLDRAALFPPATIRASRVPGSQEWADVDGRRTLVQEGEVRVHVAWQDGAGTGHHVGFLGGHTSAGWAPRPSGYAIASLAASSLLSLRRTADALGIDPEALEVEVEVVSDRPAGGKEASQDAAADGRPDRVRWRRMARLGTLGRRDPSAILAALAADPIAAILASGDLLAEDRVVVAGPATVGAA